MIETVSVGDAVAFGPMFVALPIAVTAGLVSFLSPCCLPLVPGYLAYVTGSAGADAQASGATVTLRRSSTIWGTLLFVLGFAAVFTSYGALFGALGATLVGQQGAITRALGVVTIAMGLMYVGAFSQFSLLSRTARIQHRPRLGLLGAPLLGILFGIGWTPCIGPALAAVLTLSTTSGSAGRGAILSFAYSLGLGLPFVLAALGITWAFAAFALARTHARTVMRAGGLMLIVLGVLQVSGVWFQLMAQLQGTIGSWQSPL